GISAMDDSFMSMISGVATNLFLVLVTLRIARQFRRPTFHLLSWLSLVSLVGFITLRMLPFSPHFE
ncbi:MAG: hypothetical protein ACPGXK_16875, partial [Phycisphaerae bacterium]